MLLGTLLQTVFLGPLRLIEAEHLYENSWYSISEIFLAMTIFREEFDTRFAFFFCLLLAVKMFHWLVKDRLDYVCFSSSFHFSREHLWLDGANAYSYQTLPCQNDITIDILDSG